MLFPFNKRKVKALRSNNKILRPTEEQGPKDHQLIKQLNQSINSRLSLQKRKLHLSLRSYK